MDEKPQTTDTEDLALAIKEFEQVLPYWWFSVGKCSLTRDASCGPDLSYEDAWLLKIPETTIFDEGFHCDDREGTLASSLRDVMNQGLKAKKEWTERLKNDKTNTRLPD